MFKEPHRRSGRALLGAVALVSSVLASSCGGANRSKGAQAPRPGTAALTGARVAPRVQRILVADKGVVSIVTRGGCVASVMSGGDQTGSADEMRVRCPRQERLTAWFAAVDELTSSVPVEKVAEGSDEEEVSLPAAELLTANGTVLRVTEKKDAARLASEVRALAAELEANETPTPGPASPNGWQLVRVSGTAHVFLGGEPTTGVLDARVSTTGQYLCEFVANTGEGPIRATKSGWIAKEHATKAIDDVLGPFQPVGPGERVRATYALAVHAGAERKANAASTAEVFERFSKLQDALGDACLPELDPPAPVGL
jgi:hypothetical protein